MLAVQAVLDVSEESMAYSLVMDSVCAVMYVMFLLWAINFSKEFNAWTKADVRLINEVGASLEEEAKANTKPLTWKSMLLLIGVSFFISAISKDVGSMVANALPVFEQCNLDCSSGNCCWTAGGYDSIWKIKRNRRGI